MGTAFAASAERVTSLDEMIMRAPQSVRGLARHAIDLANRLNARLGSDNRALLQDCVSGIRTALSDVVNDDRPQAKARGLAFFPRVLRELKEIEIDHRSQAGKA